MTTAHGAAAAATAAREPLTEFTDDVLHLAGGLELSLGGRLPAVDIAWRMTGPAGAPVVVVLGGISAHRRVSTVSAADPGWWPALVGDGLGVDTARYRVLSFDYLGGSDGTTGPRPGTHQRSPFPSVSTRDQVSLLIHLLDHLGIRRLHGAVGASYGGMVALALAAEHGERLENLLVVSAAEEAHPLATAWRSIQRRIVRLGLRQGNAREGLALARGLAMTTYRSPDEFARRFSSMPAATADGFRFPVEDYLDARGADFAARVSPESFLCLSESIDLQHTNPADVTVPTTLVAVRQDQLVPVTQIRQLAARLGGPSRLIEIDSEFGHDAFLKEDATLIPLFNEALEGRHS